MNPVPRRAAALALLVALSIPGAVARTDPAALPPLVFVSRDPLPERGAVPGIGPGQRSSVTRGRLMRLPPGGSPHELPLAIPLWDVASPSISPDGRRIAFAGTPHPDSAWRIWCLAERSSDSWDTLRLPVPEGRGRYDDLEPCWLDDETLLFTSTRGGARSEYDGSPVAQLWRIDTRTRALARLTAERNGVASPAFDPRRRRIFYSRWWYNRWRPAARVEPGAPPESSLTLAAARAMRPDTVNLWQPMSIDEDGGGPRVESVPAPDRRTGSLVDLAVGRDGALFGVVADALGLSPRPGALEVVARDAPRREARHFAGAYPDPATAYGSPRGLASPSAVSPAPLDDGRVVVSLDRGARGDYGLWVIDRDGENARPLADLPGTLELDAVPWTARPRPHVRASAVSLVDPPSSAPELASWPWRFRFHDRDVFGAGFGPVDSKARAAARIRFWASLARPEAEGGDTLVLVREVPVRNGRVDERDLPAGIPMFEQLLDASGNVMRSAHGPAQVAGFNVGLPGRTSSCVGCHLGHSLAR